MPGCGGHRLRPEALNVQIGGRHIGEVAALTLDEFADWVGRRWRSPANARRSVAEPILDQIRHRLRFLLQVGVSYLSLSRGTGTLPAAKASGCAWPPRWARQLTGVLYILDEPSVGLHHRDIGKLIATLKALRDRGNSVVVVEHDRDVMLAADHIIDLGPGAGEHGGEIVAQGTVAEVGRADRHAPPATTWPAGWGGAGPIP